MIFTKTKYKTHDQKFLAIIKEFKIWRHNLKSCKYEVFILINYNNFHQFIDIINSSF